MGTEYGHGCTTDENPTPGGGEWVDRGLFSGDANAACGNSSARSLQTRNGDLIGNVTEIGEPWSKT